MNKRVLYLMSVLTLFSCGKTSEEPETPDQPSGADVTLDVQMPSAAGELTFAFGESSRMVVNSERSKNTVANWETARFSFTENVKAPYSAIYPMGVYSSMDNVTVPARQKYQAGKTDEKSVVMLGYSATEKKIKLRHVMAFLKLTVNPGSLGSDNIYQISVSGTNGEQLSGDFKPDYKNAALTPTGKATTIIVRDAAEGMPMGKPIFIAVPARRSVKLAFEVTDVKGAKRSFKYDKALNLTAGSVSDVSFSFEKEEGSSTLNLTPFTMLNASKGTVGDHASKESRSYLVQMKSSVTEYNNDATLAKSPTYTRIKRLPDGTYMLMWQRGSASRSDNNGMDTFYALGSDIFGWTYKGCLFEHNDNAPGCKGGTVARYYTCPELLVLKNGNLLAVNSFWAPSTYSVQANKGDHGLAVKRSTDNGRSWSEETVIYSGQCWEPFLIEMPDGEIHCYFTEARPWISSSNSGTSLVLSKDGGKTWLPTPGEEPYRVMRKQWYHTASSMYKFTDQMPVGVDIRGTGKLAFAMEDVDSETSSSSSHSVSVVYSPGTPGWTYLKDDEVGPSTRTDKLGRDACAPYLVQFPSGETILSYSRENGTWPYCYKMGDADARNFGSEKIAMSTAGNWTGTTVDGTHCLLIASAYSKAIHLSRYALNHDINAAFRTVNVDGDNSEWANADDALYYCKDASADATMRVSSDETNLYILLEVSNIKIASSDYMSVFAGPSSASGSMDNGALRVKVGPRGLVGTSVKSSSWTSSSAAVKVASDYEGTFTDNSDVDKGWLAEISIPLSALKVNGGKITVNASFDDNPSQGVLCSLSGK